MEKDLEWSRELAEAEVEHGQGGAECCKMVKPQEGWVTRCWPCGNVSS